VANGFLIDLPRRFCKCCWLNFLDFLPLEKLPCWRHWQADGYASRAGQVVEEEIVVEAQFGKVDFPAMPGVVDFVMGGFGLKAVDSGARARIEQIQKQMLGGRGKMEKFSGIWSG
jgi:hypothetical protein